MSDGGRWRQDKDINDDVSVSVSVVPARRPFRLRAVFDVSFVAEIVSSVLDVASVVFTRVVDIASVVKGVGVFVVTSTCVSFVVVVVRAPKPTFTWPELRPLLDDDEDDDDDSEAVAGTCEGEDPPEPDVVDIDLRAAASRSFL